MSLLTQKAPEEEDMPTLAQTYAEMGQTPRSVWLLWGVLAAIMAGLYLLFD